ncbi:MAG TPA: UvrD-helicase domain-containing protein, partial [Microvirga sp.]|nr:UvrD-helicase domain-containing protein [Microvirga sp.]
MSGALPETPIVPDHTRDAQRRAADPRASAWVSANAGAGKTKVLTDRVVRLLLSGAPPGRILCLTFTKAAAANMAIRVFERLGRWVTLDEDSLRAELEELEGVRPNREQIRLARRLFARAVETPGGLKIDTIHAFCERLLHLVPFEANVPARFAVLDESQADELVAEAIAQVSRDVLDDTETDLARAHDLVVAEAGGGTLDRVLKSAVACKDFASGAGGLAAGLGRLRMALGLEEGATVEAIERSLLEGGPTRERRLALGAILDAGKTNDQKRAASLHASLQAERADEALEHYLAVFLTEEGKPRAESQLATKSVGADVKAELVDEQNRILRLLDRRRAAQALDRTGALFTLAAAVVRKVEQTKARLGALDFEDLIHKTRTLLARGDAEWVLYKLDRGIDHVLVDEAQDTNPEQWDILRRITEDFTAGHGARGERVRTLFAVGDPKQSIYGFQGAAPQEFEISRKFWQKKVAGAALRFEDVRLTLSFRSCLAVLSAVDATFGVPEHFRGLSFEDSAVGTVHESARPHAPGQVELWPVETPAAEEEPDAWAQPVDEAERTSPPVVVARRVAEAVRAWTTRGDEAGRVWRAGDILILVRKRGTAFEAVIRALK